MDLDDLLDEFEISSQEPKSQPKQPDKTKTNRDDLDDLLDEIQIDTLPKLFKKPSGSSQRCLNLVSCTHLKCLQCDFQCQYFDGFEWTTVEYLTFRNHFPDRQKLRQYLKPLKGTKVYKRIDGSVLPVQMDSHRKARHANKVDLQRQQVKIENLGLVRQRLASFQHPTQQHLSTIQGSQTSQKSKLSLSLQSRRLVFLAKRSKPSSDDWQKVEYKRFCHC